MRSNCASDLFRAITHRQAVYNIVSLDNVPSILQYGLLCYNEAQKLAHESIALNDVQMRRDNKSVPHGLRLHDYANAYFDPRNPMMYRRLNLINEICVLAIDARILDCDGVVVSDGNAASGVTRFYSPSEGIETLCYEQIYAKWWTDPDPYIQENKKRIKCAEVLVPYCIPSEYILGAIVANAEVRDMLLAQNFSRTIKVSPKTFFQE